MYVKTVFYEKKNGLELKRRGVQPLHFNWKRKCGYTDSKMGGRQVPIQDSQVAREDPPSLPSPLTVPTLSVANPGHTFWGGEESFFQSASPVL